MLREGPRRAADGCETGDWNHVDVYLTKTLDYRALVFTGSRFDADAVQWMRERGSVRRSRGPSGCPAPSTSCATPATTTRWWPCSPRCWSPSGGRHWWLREQRQ